MMMRTSRRAAGIAAAALMGLGLTTSSAGATPGSSATQDGANPDVVVLEASWLNADGRISCVADPPFTPSRRCEHRGDSNSPGAGDPSDAHQRCREFAGGTATPPLGTCSARFGLGDPPTGSLAVSRGSVDFAGNCNTSTNGGRGTLAYNSGTFNQLINIPVQVLHRWSRSGGGEGGGSSVSTSTLQGSAVFSSGIEQFRAEFNGTIIAERPIPPQGGPGPCDPPPLAGVFDGTVTIFRAL